MKEAIRQRARELGFDDCRVATALPPDSARHFEQWIAAGRHGAMGYLERNAHKRVDPRKVLPESRSVISLAVSYGEVLPCGPAVNGLQSTNPPETSRPASVEPLRGEVARYARYRDYHDVLAERLSDLTKFILDLGGQGTRSLWYVDTGPLLERDLAQRAGLGFIGKHTNLISRRLGNWIFLCEILTTLDLEPDTPGRNHCGSCARCLAACPTNAITAPFQLDARRCISYLTIELKGPIPEEFRPAIGNRIYGCDDCLAICPWNKFAGDATLMSGHARPELAAPELAGLLALDEAGFRERFAGTPMARGKRRGLLRNVCVALGNTGNASHLPALERAAQDPEELIAEHARWAIQQILRREANSRDQTP